MKQIHGITLEDIHARCREEGNCRIWEGAVSAAKDKSHWGTPCMAAKIDGKRKTVGVRRIVYQLKHGKALGDKMVASPKCGNRLCVSEHCVAGVTQQVSRQMAAARGAYSNPAKIRRATLTQRANSDITEEMVATIKAAGTGKEAAAMTGVSLSHCKYIRRGVARRDLSSPFAMNTFMYHKGSPIGTRTKPGRTQGVSHG